MNNMNEEKELSQSLFVGFEFIDESGNTCRVFDVNENRVRYSIPPRGAGFCDKERFIEKYMKKEKERVGEISITEHPNFNQPREEWCGLSMADFWDDEKGSFCDGCPVEIIGVTHFLGTFKSHSFKDELKSLMKKHGSSFRIEADENGGVEFSILDDEDEVMYTEVNCCGLTVTEYNF